MRWLVRLIAFLVVLAGAGWAALNVSPKPVVWAINWLFDRGAARASQALEKHLPAGVETLPAERYRDGEPGLSFELHRPARPTAGLPVVVWIHGGAFVSGRKEDVANYARVVANQGYAVASVDYTLAPDATYPTQARQVDAAIAHLLRHAVRLGIDPQRVLLAGDSAGAQIAAQLATAVTAPAHARQLDLEPALAPAQLRGTLLFCGVYDFAALNYDGVLGTFLRSVAWALFGARDFRRHPGFDIASVQRHVTKDFPPTFISAGNGDPLLLQSRALAERLRALGVPVETLFFAADLAPPLAHEYQFDLDRPEGIVARDRMFEFLAARLK